VLKQQLASVVEGARQLEAGVVACEGANVATVTHGPPAPSNAVFLLQLFCRHALTLWDRNILHRCKLNDHVEHNETFFVVRRK